MPGLLQALPLRPGGKGRRAFAPASSASLGARFLWSRAQSCSPTPVNFPPSVAALWLAFASVRSLNPFIHSARHRWRCCPQDTPPWPRRGRLLRRPSCHPGSSAPPERKDLRPRNCFGESRCPWDAALALPRRINAWCSWKRGTERKRNVKPSGRICSISKAFLVARRLCFVALASGPDAFCRCQASMNHELRPCPLTAQASSVNRIHADK